MAKYMPKSEMPEDEDEPTYIGRPKVAGKPVASPKPKFGPGFSSGAKDKVKNKYRRLALKNKVKGSKTAHQMHMEHVNHVTHTKNEYRRNLNSKNPYSK